MRLDCLVCCICILRSVLQHLQCNKSLFPLRPDGIPKQSALVCLTCSLQAMGAGADLPTGAMPVPDLQLSLGTKSIH